ncbi:MAG: hypothetical protein U1F43_08705 [Myxococcota bacterium]
MSKIAVIVTSAPSLAPTLAALRRAAPTSGVDELRRRIGSGTPVVELVLFENDFPAVAARLRALMRELAETGAAVRVFELRPDEAFDPEADLARWEISAQALSNILDSVADYA